MYWEAKNDTIIKNLNADKLQNFIPTNDVNIDNNLNKTLWSIQQIKEYINTNILSGSQAYKNITELYGFQGDMTQTIDHNSSDIDIITDIHFSNLNIQPINIVKDPISGNYLYEHGFYFKIYYTSNEQMTIHINQTNLNIPTIVVPQSFEIFSVYASNIFTCDIIQESDGMEDITQLNGIINDFMLDGTSMTENGYCDVFKIELVDFQKLKTT